MVDEKEIHASPEERITSCIHEGLFPKVDGN